MHVQVDVRVKQLKIHAVGGVVIEAQPLMLLVPKEDFLEVEATLENKDIGFVHVGQKVRLIADWLTKARSAAALTDPSSISI